MSNASTLTLTDVGLGGGSAGLGGGLFSAGTATLVDRGISGGGLDNPYYASLVVGGGSIAGNDAGKWGGLASFGTVSVTRIAISNNTSIPT